MRRRRATGLDTIRALCLVFAAWPNCTRCCPANNGGCQCNYAWQDCPPVTGCGGGGCGSSSSSGCNAATAESSGPTLFEAGTFGGQSMVGDATVAEESGGTLAFVTTDSGTFAIATVGAKDEVRIFRIDANALDDDPLTVRPVGIVALHGDDPGRIAADRARAIVSLRSGSAIAMVDPLTFSVVERRPVCRTPGAIAVDGDAIHVACTGELVTMRRTDGTELHRSALDTDLRLVIATGGALTGTDGTSWRALEASGNAADASTSLPASVTDFAALGDDTAYVDDGDAYFRDARVSPGLTTRSVALADIKSERVTRRVLAIQTSSPRLVVFFTVSTSLVAGPIEPLE